MTAFRDPDRSELGTFAQHLSIAETLMGVQHELDQALHPDSTREERMASAQAWNDLWIQLQQARAIATRFGRDVAAYDVAFARGGSCIDDPVMGLRIAPCARTAVAEALDALRAAFPEIVIPRPPPPAQHAPGASPPWRPSPMMIYRLTLLTTVLSLLVLVSICGR